MDYYGLYSVIKRNEILTCMYNMSIGFIVICWVFKKNKNKNEPGMVVHSFDPSTPEAEAGRFLRSRPTWSTEWVPGHPGLHRETLSQKTNQPTNQQKLPNLSIVLFCFFWDKDLSVSTFLVLGSKVHATMSGISYSFFFFFKEDLFLYMLVHCCCLQAHQKRASDPIYRWLWATTGLFGTELRTSERAVSALNCWAISPAIQSYS